MFKLAIDQSELHESVKNYRATYLKYNKAQTSIADEIAVINSEIAVKRQEIADKEASVNLKQLFSQIGQYQKQVTEEMTALGLNEYRYNDKIVSLIKQAGKFTIAQEDLIHLTENVRRKDEELAVFIEDLFAGLAEFKRVIGTTIAFKFEDTVEKHKREEKELKQKGKEPAKPRLTRTPEEYEPYFTPAFQPRLQSSRKTAGIIDWLKDLWSSVKDWWTSFTSLFIEYSAMQDETEIELDEIINQLDITETEQVIEDTELFDDDSMSGSSANEPVLNTY